jgi:hypothetical protein
LKKRTLKEGGGAYKETNSEGGVKAPQKKRNSEKGKLAPELDEATNK